MIKYLSRRHINEDLWNGVIESSIHEMIYPYTWYLDTYAENWGALVLNDYEYVLPLVFRKKIGVKYLFQPTYCQQLGIFASKEIDSEVIRLFLKEIQKHFKWGDYAFNASNVLGEGMGVEFSDNTNYVMDIRKSYDYLLKNYSHNCKRNVKKSYHQTLTMSDELSVEDVIMLKKNTSPLKKNEEHYDFVRSFFSKLNEEGKLIILGAHKENHLCGVAVFAKSKKRYFYLLSASDSVGKDASAMFFIVDSFVQKHADEGMYLDFEGSNIPSIARFFRGFGAKPEIYQRVYFGSTAGKIVRRIKDV